MRDPAIFFVEHNAPRGVLSALNASLFETASASSGSAASVTLMNVIMLGVALAILALASLQSVAPSIRAVQRESLEVFDIFGNVPIKVVRHLRDELEQRILDLQRQSEGFDDNLGAAELVPDSSGGGGAGGAGGAGGGFDDGTSGEDGTRTRGAGLAAAVANARALKRQAAAEGELELSARRAEAASASSRLSRVLVAAGCGTCARWRDARAGALVRRAAAARAKVVAAAGARGRVVSEIANSSALLLRMLLPIVLYGAYSVGVYFARAKIVSDALATQTQALWAVELQLFSLLAGLSLRNAAMATEPAWVAEATAALRGANAGIDTVTRAFVDGSDALGLSSVVSSSPRAYSLFFQNGCVSKPVSAAECSLYGPSPFYGCNEYYDYSMCKLPQNNVDITLPSFAYGLVGTGLLQGVRAVTTAAGTVVDARLADLAAHSAGGTPLPFVSCDHTATPSANTAAADFSNQMFSTYLAGGLDALVEGVIGEGAATLASDLATDVLALAGSFFFLALAYFAWYMPVIRAADVEIKRQRALLLLVPEGVMKAVPAFVQAVNRFAIASSN